MSFSWHSSPFIGPYFYLARIWFKVDFFSSPAPPPLYWSLIDDMFVSYLRILGCLVATAEQFQVQMVFLLQEILQVILLEKQRQKDKRLGP